MRLNFLINKDYLVSHSLWSYEQGGFSSDENQKDILDFVNAVWNKSKIAYELLSGKLIPDGFITKASTLSELVSSATKSKSALSDIKRLPEFTKVFKQTEAYLKSCKSQWTQNFSKTEEAIKELTGLALDKNFTVYITHPSLRNGRNFGKIGTTFLFAWGRVEDWPNYITVYFWHEILHSYFDKSELSHAVIQLLTDNELRVRLNGGKYPPFEGHPNLFPMMEKLLPRWKKYLESKSKNIQKFLELAK
ncbi:hypothetical protein HY441_02055 [Candidatus Microgenomates bacterium]|nr:hypothetical protein [Candidatus Microgenomates bacterium]